MNTRPVAAAAASAVLLAGCATPTTENQPTGYVTETGDTVVICGPIARKDDTYPGRWAFEFTHDGGWTAVPVPSADFGRYAVGDWVLVTHRVGEVAQVRADRCGRVTTPEEQDR